jgi:hypothetical protein
MSIPSTEHIPADEDLIYHPRVVRVDEAVQVYVHSMIMHRQNMQERVKRYLPDDAPYVPVRTGDMLRVSRADGSLIFTAKALLLGAVEVLERTAGSPSYVWTWPWELGTDRESMREVAGKCTLLTEFMGGVSREFPDHQMVDYLMSIMLHEFGLRDSYCMNHRFGSMVISSCLGLSEFEWGPEPVMEPKPVENVAVAAPLYDSPAPEHRGC